MQVLVGELCLSSDNNPSFISNDTHKGALVVNGLASRAWVGDIWQFFRVYHLFSSEVGEINVGWFRLLRKDKRIASRVSGLKYEDPIAFATDVLERAHVDRVVGR
jgi:hypothetical protein